MQNYYNACSLYLVQIRHFSAWTEPKGHPHNFQQAAVSTSGTSITDDCFVLFGEKSALCIQFSLSQHINNPRHPVFVQPVQPNVLWTTTE